MTAKKTKKSTPWFPPSPDRDHLERVLVVLVRSWGSGISLSAYIVTNYLDGKWLDGYLSQHQIKYLDSMTRTLGMKPPKPS